MEPLNIHGFLNAEFERLGSIEGWARSRKHRLRSTRFYEHDGLPQLEAVDWLVIMGGPMGVADEARYPWLTLEKKFIEQAIKHGKAVIGICLGAQLIADVLGARVYRCREKEIGWFPVLLTEEGKKSDFFNFLPGQFFAFQWHGDTFDLPEGAIHIARTSACENQAFVYGDRIVGLQFHLEVTGEAINEIVRHGKEELVSSTYVQSDMEILRSRYHIQDVNKKLNVILDRIKED